MILHLFKNDLRRARILLFVWCAIIALQITVVGASGHPGDLVWGRIFDLVTQLAPALRIFVLIVLIPLVVLEAPLVGTTAFWFSRPIQRSELIQAKLLTLSLLAASATVAELIVLRMNGATAHDLALATPEILLSLLAAIAAIAVLASLTATFGRYAIVGAILFVGLMVLSFILFAVVSLVRTGAEGSAVASLLQTRTFVAEIAIVAGGAVVLVWQYLTRRALVSWIGVAVVIAASSAISLFWPWDLLMPTAAGGPNASEDYRGVSVAVRTSNTMDFMTGRAGSDPLKMIEAGFSITGLPRGLFAIPRSTTADLRAGGSFLAKTASVQNFWFGNNDTPNLQAIESALPDATVVNAGYFSEYPEASLGTVTAEFYNRNAGKPLALSAGVPFVVYRYAVTAELPIERGARYDSGSQHETITDVLHEGDGVEIVLQRRAINLMFDRSPSSANAGWSGAGNRANAIYVLHNPKRHQTVLIKQSGRNSDTFSSRERVIRTTVGLPFGPEQYVMAPAMDDAWLADAKLVRLERVMVAKLTRPVAMDAFRLDARNTDIRAEVRPKAQVATSIAHLKLSSNASKADIRRYVEDILLASQRRQAFEEHDPQVEMLTRVGDENLDVLIEAYNWPGVNAANYYLTVAINRLAQPKDKAAILAALPRAHDLIDIVVKYDWKVEAHDTLVAALKDERIRYLPAAWIKAVASFEEPDTYPELEAYLVRGSNRQQTFNAIVKLPGIDLQRAVDEAWKNAQRGGIYQALDGCTMALTFGHADALDTLVAVMKDHTTEPASRRAGTLFKRFTPATGDVPALIAWYGAHRGELAFDAAAKKFLVRSVAQ